MSAFIRAEALRIVKRMAQFAPGSRERSRAEDALHRMVYRQLAWNAKQELDLRLAHAGQHEVLRVAAVLRALGVELSAEDIEALQTDLFQETKHA